MLKIFEAYAERRGLNSTGLRFGTIDGNRILEEETPRLLELEENDIIYVFLHQCGC